MCICLWRVIEHPVSRRHTKSIIDINVAAVLRTKWGWPVAVAIRNAELSNEMAISDVTDNSERHPGNGGGAVRSKKVEQNANAAYLEPEKTTAAFDDTMNNLDYAWLEPRHDPIATDTNLAEIDFEDFRNEDLAYAFSCGVRARQLLQLESHSMLNFCLSGGRIGRFKHRHVHLSVWGFVLVNERLVWTTGDAATLLANQRKILDSRLTYWSQLQRTSQS